jgi:hypothetical protein
MLEPGRATRRRGWPRRRAACSTRWACRVRASTRSCSATCRGCCRAARARWSRSPARPSGVRRAGGPAVRRGRRHRDRGQPLVPERGGRRAVFACDPQRAGSVVAAVRGSARYDIPVFAKLSPDVTDIVAVASACVAAGADGLSLINTLLGMAIDPAPCARRWPARTAGCPGPRSGRSRCGASGRCARRARRADHRDGRRAYRPGRAGAAARGRVHGRGGHGDHARPVGLLARPARAGGGTGAIAGSTGPPTSSGRPTAGFRAAVCPADVVRHNVATMGAGARREERSRRRSDGEQAGAGGRRARRA